MATFWIINVPICVLTNIKNSIVYLVFISVMTAFSGEMAALHGITVQKNQEES